MDQSTDRSRIDQLWDYSDPAESERRFLEVVDSFRAEPLRHGELLTQLARSRGLQRRFDDAHRTLDEAEVLIGPDASIPHVRLLLERGRAHRSAGDPASAVPLFERAWQMATELDDSFDAADAAHMLAIAEVPERAVVWFERAIDLAEGSTEERTRGWIGPLTNNVAWTYHDLGQYEKALEYFRRNVEWHRVIFQETGRNQTELEIARWSVGRALRSLGRAAEALEIQREVLREAKDRGRTDTGYVHEEIGECLTALRRLEEARPSFARAYELLSEDQWLSAEEPDRLARMKELGGVA